MCLVPTPVLLCLVIQPKVMHKMAYSPKRVLPEEENGTLGSVLFLLIVLYGIWEGAVLEAVLEVVHHCSLEVLDGARLSKDVALVWVQL